MHLKLQVIRTFSQNPVSSISSWNGFGLVLSFNGWLRFFSSENIFSVRGGSNTKAGCAHIHRFRDPGSPEWDGDGDGDDVRVEEREEPIWGSGSAVLWSLET